MPVAPAEVDVGLFGSKKERDPSDLIREGDLDGAIKILRKRVKTSPEDHRLRNHLGDALASAGKSEDALAEYQLVADGYAADGFTAKALAIWKKMSRMAPDDEALLARIASVAGGTDVKQKAPDPALPESPLFPDFTPEEFGEVARLIEHRRFDAGERIVAEGEPGESLFVIGEGTVRVSLRIGGTDLELATLGPGDFFGEVAVLKKKIRTASIDAAEACEVLELSRADLDQIVEKHPRVREVMEDFTSRRAERTVEAMVEARRAGPAREG